MTGERIIQVVNFYGKILDRRHPQIRSLEFPENQRIYFSESAELVIGHVRSMIPRIREFVEQGRIEKAFRWLGFVQCAFWGLGIFTLNELKNHNRPDISPPQ